jgi:hypothetical protein
MSYVSIRSNFPRYRQNHLPRIGRLFTVVIVSFLFAIQSWARDLRVGIDPDIPTIAHAIKAALPGDTIHLEPKVYRDYAGFYGKMGQPGQPITLEGHGAILDGSDPLDPAAWTEVSPGLFANPDLLPRFDTAMLARWFFLWNGSVNRMGLASKGKSAPLKAPEDLASGEWTFVRDPSRDLPESRQIFGTFYLKIAPGKTLAEESIFVPVRSAGVQFSGDNAHLVIRNLTARYPYNDGFNIHGDCRDVVFENITAIGCGDDGISAHESAQYRVNGFASIGNSTGICDTGTAQTSYEKVYIADCVSVDLYFLDEGRYSLRDVLVESSAQQPFILTGRAKGDCRLNMDNVYIRRLLEPRLGQVAMRATLAAKDCTFEGMDLRLVGAATFENCLINESSSSVGASGANLEVLQEALLHYAHSNNRTSTPAVPRSLAR